MWGITLGGDGMRHRQVTNLRQNPSATENVVKMQGERQMVQDLVTEVLEEMAAEDTFYSLVTSVNDQVEEKAKLNETIHREEASQKMVEELTEQATQIQVTP